MRHPLYIACILLLLGCRAKPPQGETVTTVTDSLVTFPPAGVSLSHPLSYDAVHGFTPIAVTERQGRARVSANLDASGNLKVTADCDEQQVLVKKVRVLSSREVPVAVTRLPWFFYPVLVLLFLLGAFVAYALSRLIDFFSLR